MRALNTWLSIPVLFSLVTPLPAPSPDLAAIKSFYETGLRRNGILGSSLVLIRNGQVVLHDNYGVQSQSPTVPVDDNTTYHWASCTKTFTGIAIMQLRDRGLLSLDDPLIKYLPELAAVHDPYGPISKVTIRHVMSHSGGFRDATWPWRDADWQPFEPTQWSQIVAMLPYTNVAFEPGSRFSYSNLGVVFLGEIIEPNVVAALLLLKHLVEAVKETAIDERDVFAEQGLESIGFLEEIAVAPKIGCPTIPFASGFVVFLPPGALLLLLVKSAKEQILQKCPIICAHVGRRVSEKVAGNACAEKIARDEALFLKKPAEN